MRIQVDLLGRFRVIVDGAVIPADTWRRERSSSLVKLVALSPGHRLHREQAMDALWPDLDADAAGANLRKAIHFARKTLEAHDAIGMANEIVALAPGGECIVDADAFDSAAKAAIKTRDRAHCERAADLYGGELLPEDRYASWTEGPRDHLRQLYARLLKTGSLWERLLELDPTDEEAQRAVMQAALDAGNRGEVIRHFRRLREHLRVDLGVGPAAATVAIYEKALRQQGDETVSVVDRVRGSLAWGIIHLNSGDFPKAEEVAREARLIAIEAGLAREVGEASALFGLAAHMQGRWQQVFRTEFTEWVKIGPKPISHIFDGHVCLAQFCLCAAGDLSDVASYARDLLVVANAVSSDVGRALATLIIGESELFAGDLDAAATTLAEAERLYEISDSVPGRVISLERLAQVALTRGQKWRAGRLLQKAFRVGDGNWLSPHLLIRLHALSIGAAQSRTRAREAIAVGDELLSGKSTCQPCSMGFRVAAAIALAEDGDSDLAGRRLDDAERLAGMWQGGPWVAAVWEARGVHRKAKGQPEQAAALFREAAARFAALGRLGDEARCLARVS